MVAMESTERASEACCDYIVDLTSPLLLCRCGYPKKEHVESPENKRRTLTKVPSLTTLFGEAPAPEPPSPSRPQACDSFMIDLLQGFGLCRCGHPKGAHGDSEDGSPPKRFSVSQDSSAVRALRQSFSSKADANAPLSMLEGRRSRKSVGNIASALDRFENFAKGHEAQRAGDDERAQRVERVLQGRHRCQTAPAAVIEADVQVAEGDGCSRDGPELATSASESSSSDDAARADNGDAVKAARAKWAQAGEEAAERAAAEKIVAEERRLKEAEAAAAARRREEKQVALKLAEELMAEEREQKALEEKHAAEKEAEERQAAEKLAEEQKSVDEVAPPSLEAQEESTIMPQPKGDRTAVVNAGVVQAARAKWTQAAQEAEERAAAERAEMEERAAARRAKEVDAAVAARRREEKQAAAEQAKEQKALEKALEKEQKALEEKQAAAVFLFAEQKQSEEQKALDEQAAQEAKKEAAAQVAARIAHIEQQNQKRLGKIRQREEEALLKAEMRENEERAKAARIAALRTQTVTCAGGGELMVTPEELQTLTKYVPNWAESTSGDLAELLPQLHMGAWLQGTKQLFANTACANARPRSNSVPNSPKRR